MHDQASYRTLWLIRKFASDLDFINDHPYEEVSVDGNLLLTTGVTALWTLFAGAGGTAYNNTNARIGVGDSSTAEAAGQTALQAATNKLFKAMSASYPTISGNAITFRSAFASAEANYTWNELAVDNGTTLLNRKVSAQGTKASGQTWTIDLTISLS